MDAFMVRRFPYAHVLLQQNNDTAKDKKCHITQHLSTTFWQTVFDNTHDDGCLKHSSLFYLLMSLRNCYGQISCILIFHTLVFMISNISTFDGIIMFHSKFEFQLRKPEIIL